MNVFTSDAGIIRLGERVPIHLGWVTNATFPLTSGNIVLEPVVWSPAVFISPPQPKQVHVANSQLFLSFQHSDIVLSPQQNGEYILSLKGYCEIVKDGNSLLNRFSINSKPRIYEIWEALLPIAIPIVGGYLYNEWNRGKVVPAGAVAR